MLAPDHPDLIAALYDALHDGTPGDLGLYADACADADAVLELGCGSGRLLPTLARAASDVVGLDHDLPLMRIAAARVTTRRLGNRVRLVHGDMRTHVLPRQFDRVVVPFNGLWCLEGTDAMTGALRNAGRHLCRDGQLWLDVYRADEFHSESTPQDLAEDTLLPIARVQVDGTAWEVFERSTWKPEPRIIHANYLHVGEDGRRVQTTIRHHYKLRDEIEALVQGAGFCDVQLRRGLAADESWIVSARWPGPAASDDESLLRS